MFAFKIKTSRLSPGGLHGVEDRANSPGVPRLPDPELGKPAHTTLHAAAWTFYSKKESKQALLLLK
jgi:hypothetical protein